MQRLEKPGLVALLALAAGLTWVAQSNATTASAPLTIEELSNRSDLVVQGRVESIRNVPLAPRVFTFIDVAVADVLKGQEGSETVTVKLYGGVLGDFLVAIDGAPCFGLDEEVVLFLGANGQGTYEVIHLAEGKFRVVQGATEPSVERDLDGICYLEETTPPAVPTSLEDLKAAVLASSR